MSKVKEATVKTDEGKKLKLTPAQLARIAQENEKRKRAGSMIADGVMWCPGCGSRAVTNGHVTCRDCDDTIPLTMEEYRAIKDKEKTPADKAAEPDEDMEISEELEEEIEAQEDEEAEEGEKGKEEKPKSD